jgi:hypothetical protein
MRPFDLVELLEDLLLLVLGNPHAGVGDGERQPVR